ncbi:uncharacterized protein LOC144433312 [Glandiceps talaboti]
MSLSIVLASVILWLARGSKNCAPSPASCFTDHVTDVFQYSNIYGVRPTKKLLYFLDTVYSYVVVQSLVIVYWRGMWGLIDNVIRPDNLEKSAYTSLVIGYPIIIMTHIIQYPCAIISRKAKRFSRVVQIIVEDMFWYLCSFGVLNIWRGLWYICDLYIYPENLAISYLKTSLVGFVTLYLLQSARNLGGAAVSVDGIPDDGSGVLLGHYFKRLNSIWTFEEKENLSADNVNDQHSDGPISIFARHNQVSNAEITATENSNI